MAIVECKHIVQNIISVGSNHNCCRKPTTCTISALDSQRYSLELFSQNTCWTWTTALRIIKSVNKTTSFNKYHVEMCCFIWNNLGLILTAFYGWFGFRVGGRFIDSDCNNRNVSVVDRNFNVFHITCWNCNCNHVAGSDYKFPRV